MAKYKPGDIVVIDPLLREGYENSRGERYCVSSTRDMAEKAGQITTILMVVHEQGKNVVYHIEGSHRNWDEKMFAGLIEEEATVEISNSDLMEILKL